MSKISVKRSARVRRSRTGHKNKLAAAVVLAFAAGLAVCAVLFAVFAALLTATPIPLSAARPLACMGAAIGAAAAGFLLARRVGRGLLLCGAASGVFYAVCVLLASVIVQGEVNWQGDELFLPLALLLGGILGGALAAVRRNR